MKFIIVCKIFLHWLTVWFLLLAFTAGVHAQVPDIVMTDGIIAPMQKENIGRIFFTQRKIETPGLKYADFLKSYKLTHKSDLFFVAYFDNSITNYKHRLSPGIASDSLFKLGNYQFCFYVDHKEIYRTNLIPGAPQANAQDRQTLLNRPLIDNINGQGTWSESAWNRFFNNGGEQALSEGNHIFKMEIRPYLGSVVGDIIASGELPVTVARNITVDTGSIQLSSIVPYDGIPVSGEAFDSQKIKQLKGLITEGYFKKINGIVVLKHGKLLIEEYFNGENRDSLHDPRSVGKSFTSTLVGIAIADKHLKSENQKLNNFYNLKQFKNYNPLKAEATLKDLLTMKSGFQGNDEDVSSPGNEENMYPTADWVTFVLDLPYNENLRQKWHYFTAGVVLLGDILNKTVPGGLEKYAEKSLFSPLNITQYKWQYTPQNIPNTAGGIKMNALDFAKYGQLYKNGGKWNGRQVLPEEWVKRTLQKQTKIDGRNDEYYSYLFWNKSFIANSKIYDAFYCAGNGGNYIIIFKDMPLVIVITASAYGQPYAHKQVAEMISGYILPAIVN